MNAAGAPTEGLAGDLSAISNSQARGATIAGDNAGALAAAEGDAGGINHPNHGSKTHDEVWALMSLARIYYVTVRLMKCQSFN